MQKIIKKLIINNNVAAGSLYALVLSNNRSLGAVTPIGGVAFIAGWLSILI